MATKTKIDYQKIYEDAVAAGQAEAENVKVEPMIVGTPKNFFGDEIDFTQPTYVVAGGVCGFATVVITSARGGFVQFLKMRNIGYKAYYGGYAISARPKVKGAFVQSMTINEAWAGGFAEVLRENGIDASVESRMD